MDSLEKIKKICNYIEVSTSINSPPVIYYLDYKHQLDAGTLERQKREIFIDSIIMSEDEFEKSEKERSEAYSEANTTWNTDYNAFQVSPGTVTESFGEISISFASINLKKMNFINFDHAYGNLINFIDSNTNITNSNSTLNKPYTEKDLIIFIFGVLRDIYIESGNHFGNNVVICGSNAFVVIEDLYRNHPHLNFEIIYDGSIDPNKVILTPYDKNNTKTLKSSGIYLTYNPDDGFYMAESPKWEKSYSWFWV